MADAGAGSTQPAPRSAAADAETLKQHGSARLAADDLLGALYKYSQALQLLAGDASAATDASSVPLRTALHANVALVNLKLQRYGDALDAANAALALQPTHECVLCRRATARAKLVTCAPHCVLQRLHSYGQ